MLTQANKVRKVHAVELSAAVKNDELYFHGLQIFSQLTEKINKAE